MKKFSAFTVCILILALLLSGCTSNNGGEEKEVAADIGDAVASVEGELVTYEQLEAKANQLAAMYQVDLSAPGNASMQQLFFEQVLMSLIDEIILDQQPDFEKFMPTDEEIQKQITTAKEQFATEEEFQTYIAGLKMTDEGLYAYIKEQIYITNIINDITKDITEPTTDPKEYYDTNVNEFYQTEQRTASHILVVTEDEAKDIIARLDKGEDFFKLVEEKSVDVGSIENQGKIGPFTKDDTSLLPEFINAVYSMQTVGEYSKTPVQTLYGFHVIKLEQITPSKQYTYDEVQALIAQQLLMEAKQTKYEEYMQELRGKTKIINNLKVVLDKKAAEKEAAGAAEEPAAEAK